MTNENVARFIQYMIELYLQEAEGVEDVTGLVTVTVPTDLQSIKDAYGGEGNGGSGGGDINIEIAYEGDTYTVENYTISIHKNMDAENGVRFPWEPDVNAAQDLWEFAIEYLIGTRPWASENWEEANGQPSAAFPSIESHYTTGDNGYVEKMHIYCGAGATLTNENVARFIQYALEIYLTEAEGIEDVTGLVAVTVPTDLSGIQGDYGGIDNGQSAGDLIDIVVTYNGDTYTVEDYDIVIHKNFAPDYTVVFPWDPQTNAAQDLWELAVEYNIGVRPWNSENWEEPNGQPSIAFPSIESKFTEGEGGAYTEKLHIYCGAGATLTNENVARFIQYMVELYLIEAEGLGETIDDVAGLVTVTVPTDLSEIQGAYGGEDNGGGAGGLINIEIAYDGDNYTVENYEIVIHKNFDANNGNAVRFPWEPAETEMTAEELWTVAMEYMAEAHPWDSSLWPEMTGQPSEAFPALEYNGVDVEKLHIYVGASASFTDENISRFIQYTLELCLEELGIAENAEGLVTASTSFVEGADWGGVNPHGSLGKKVNIEITYEGDAFTVTDYEVVVHKNYDANNGSSVTFPWEV